MSEKFEFIGTPASAQEERSSALCRGEDGILYFVICSRGFIVSINLHTKETKQILFPEKYMDFPYASMASRAGKVYTGAGRMFMEFDPATGAFTHHYFSDEPDIIIGWGFSEDAEGNIYCGTYPRVHLYKFDPVAKELTDYGRMDDTQNYMGTVCPGNDGWVYMGIGTEKNNIVAFNPSTRERCNLVPETLRQKGSGHVYKGTNGEIYGTFLGEMHNGGEIKDTGWKLLRNGECFDVEFESLPESYLHNGVFATIHDPFLYNSILHYSLTDCELTYIHPETKETVEMIIEYTSEGANLSPLTSNNRGKIYGSTNHPFQFFSYDTKTRKLTNHGRKMAPSLGNICAYAQIGDVIGGAAYSGGYILRLDNSMEISSGPVCNPRVVAKHEEIHRPRCSLSLRDGRRMLFSGFGGYGDVGGGLCIYDIHAGKTDIIPNDRLVRYASPMSMLELADGTILIATSVDAPGGGIPRLGAAVLFGYDLQNRKVTFECVPVNNACSIEHAVSDPNGNAHCITNNGVYFVFDTAAKKVVHSQDVSAFGSVVRAGLMKYDDSTAYGLCSNVIYKIDLNSSKAEIVEKVPDGKKITAGMAMYDNNIYFGMERQLYVYSLK